MCVRRTHTKKLPYPSEQMNRSDLVQLLSDRFSQLTQGDAETAVFDHLGGDE